MTKQATKRYVNPEPVIERLLGSWGLWKAGSGMWRSVCPFHEGAENKSQFMIRGNGRWTCFTCGAFGDLEQLIMLMEKLTYQQAKEYISNLPTQIVSLEESILPPWEDRKKEKRPYPLLPESAIAVSKKACPVYLLDRGFSERALQAYEIGYDHTKSRIVFPARDVHGKLVGITLRLDFDVEGPKYFHDEWNKSIHLYGLHKWKNKPVRRFYLVEGQLDVVRMWQLGHAAAAIMGSSIDMAQVELLKRYVLCEELVLMYDNDEAGEKAKGDSILKLCRTQFGRALKIAQYDKEDPGAMGKRDRLDTLHWTQTILV